MLRLPFSTSIQLAALLMSTTGTRSCGALRTFVLNTPASSPLSWACPSLDAKTPLQEDQTRSGKTSIKNSSGFVFVRYRTKKEEVSNNEKETRKVTELKMFVEIVEPGLVILRNFVSDKECQKIAKCAQRMGSEGRDGFYCFDEASGLKVLNTGEDRGRIYDKASRFPSWLIDHCHRAVKIATKSDEAMPTMICTHVLLNMYTTSAGLVWHRDIYENDGSGEYPVVNLCVGASCKFGFKHRDEDPERILILRSGDCLLFGGRCRYIKHAVLEVNLKDSPKWMKHDPKRYSFTFRDSPEVIGREEEFKYFKIKEDLVGQDDFEARLE